MHRARMLILLFFIIGPLLGGFPRAEAQDLQGTVTGRLDADGGHDWWGIAWGSTDDGEVVLVVDSFQEALFVFDMQRVLLRSISEDDIGTILTNGECGVQTSPGSAGVRSIAAHPEGGFILLVAGEGPDTIVRILPDFSMQVLSCSFQPQAMIRGDEDDSFPRVSIGGSPSVILMTTKSPDGVAVLNLADGSLLHLIQSPNGVRYFGAEIVPGSQTAYLFRETGEIDRYDNIHNPDLEPVQHAVIPLSSETTQVYDLTINGRWRSTSSPTALALTSDGVFSVDLTINEPKPLLIENKEIDGSIAADISRVEGVAAFAIDEFGYLDDGL